MPDILQPDPVIQEIRLEPVASKGELVAGDWWEPAEPQHIPWWRRYWMFIVLVVVPMALASLYLGLIASDQYVSEARFIVRTSARDDAGNLRNSESARKEAQQQQLYLETIVEPNLADQPLYPKRILSLLFVLGHQPLRLLAGQGNRRHRIGTSGMNPSHETLAAEQILPPAQIEADRAVARAHGGQIRQLKPRVN